jgi:hypothetical protein
LLQILFSLTSYLPSSPIVIPFAKLSANFPSLSLVLSSDQKRFNRCNMFYPTTKHASIVVIRFAQGPKTLSLVFLGEQQRSCFCYLLNPETKNSSVVVTFCPTNENASNAFARFVQRTTMLLCCLVVLPKTLSS